MSIRKKLLLTAAALGVVALLVLALRPSPVPVSVVEAQRAAFVETVEEEGVTELREPYVVSAPIAGYLQRVRLEPGDRVAAGDVLFTLESHPAPALDARSRRQATEALAAAQARLRSAEAQLQQQGALLELAEADMSRQQRLFEAGSVSREVLDRARSARDAARAAHQAVTHQKEVARFEVEAARAVLDIAEGARDEGERARLQVQSPLDGIVLRRHERHEGAVQAGQAVLEIGDLATLEARVDLLSMDAVRVREGMRVVIERWGGDRELEGHVRRVEPAGFMRISALGVEEQRVPVRVALGDEARAHLGDGFRIEARFVLWEDDEVLQVPTSALFRDDDAWAVYVVADGRASLRAVVPGRRAGLWTQIEDGLASGEAVVTHPGDRIADGVRVAPELRRYR